MGDEGNSGLTVEELTDMLSAGVASRVGGQLADVSAQVDGVVGQLDALAGRVAALESGVEGVAVGVANTHSDLQTASASLASLEEASLQGDEIGPVLDDGLGSLITIVGQVLEMLDTDGDGASDVSAAVSDIHASVQELSETLIHPVMTTNIEDYTVLEGLLLILVVSLFFKAWKSMLEVGFRWLR